MLGMAFVYPHHIQIANAALAWQFQPTESTHIISNDDRIHVSTAADGQRHGSTSMLNAKFELLRNRHMHMCLKLQA